MEISIVILSCVILGVNPEMPFFIRLIMICNLNGFRQIKYIHLQYLVMVVSLVVKWLLTWQVLLKKKALSCATPPFYPVSGDVYRGPNYKQYMWLMRNNRPT